MKGAGFFIGSVMLSTIGFRGGLWDGRTFRSSRSIGDYLPPKLGAGVCPDKGII